MTQRDQLHEPVQREDPEDPIDVIVSIVPRHLWVAIGAVVVMVLAGSLFFDTPARPSLAEDSVPALEETVEGRVLEVLDEEQVTDIEGGSFIQRVRVLITRGSQQGQQVEIEYGERTLLAPSSRVRAGDRVLLEHLNGPAGERWLISDFVRWPALTLVILLFVVAAIIVGQWVGVRALVSVGINVLTLGVFIIPGILSGANPVVVCIAGALFLMTASLYLIYQWTWKTHVALAGLVSSFLVTGLLAALLAQLGRLSGLGSEDAIFLMQAAPTPIDLRGLLLGGVMIGAVGVLDDITVGQASATFELKRANPSLHWRALFEHSMVIGRDHIASMVNTLLLAYAGASLPLFLLLATQNLSLMQTLNREFLAEEIIRTLVGSLGLILAVPLTSLIAALVAHRAEQDTAVTEDTDDIQHGPEQPERAEW